MKTISDMVYGKVPPQSSESERAVLGAITLEKGAFDRAADILQPECFYLEVHQRIFGAMAGLASADEPIDIVTLVNALRKSGDLEKVGGAYALAQLQNDIVSSAHLENHCRIIYQKFLSRELIRISGEIIGGAYADKDPFDLLENLEQQISGLTIRQQGKKFETLADVAAISVQRIYEAKTSGNELTGVPSGLPQIDNLTQGWQPTNFIILAARPGVGKSAVAGNLAMNAATHPVKPIPSAIFSLEMSSGQWADRMLAATTRISLHNLKRGRIDDAEMERLQRAALIDYKKIPIYLDDSPNMTLSQFKRKCRLLVTKFGVGFILVDYLQLMDGSPQRGENREREVSRISRDLKQLAKELRIPIMALSQLSRAGDKGEPMLSHLRECVAVDEWVYTPSGPVKIGTSPSQIITLSNDGTEAASCEFIQKKFNTVYRLRTQYGQVRATANHLILTGTGWKKVRDIDPIRDVVASAKIIPHANKGSQPHARFLGWMIGNGGFSGTPSLIYRKELDTDVKKEVDKFGVNIQYRKTQKSDNVLDTYLSNGVQSGSLTNPVMAWLRDLGLEGRTCYTKFIPDIFLGSSDETHRDLLRGLWEADGTVTGGTAKYSTVSEMLARQIGWLLLTIGVRSTVNKYEGLWEVRCSKADNETMRELVDNAERFGELDAPNEDYLDPSPSIFVELAAELSQDSVIRFQKKASGEYKSISKPRMSLLLKSFPIPTIEKSPYMSLPDTGWGRVYSIEKEDQEVKVCDLAVPFTHNFIANGIIIHNSGAIEQDADDVFFLYPVDEEEAAADASLKDSVLFIIAKHRNGMLDKLPLKFVKSIQKLMTEQEYEKYITGRIAPGFNWKQANVDGF